jgi:hypothetical protein
MYPTKWDWTEDPAGKFQESQEANFFQILIEDSLFRELAGLPVAAVLTAPRLRRPLGGAGRRLAGLRGWRPAYRRQRAKVRVEVQKTLQVNRNGLTCLHINSNFLYSMLYIIKTSFCSKYGTPLCAP